MRVYYNNRMNASTRIRMFSFVILSAGALLPAVVSASVALPPLSNFTSGQVLKAADLSAVLQNLLDLKSGSVTNSTSGSGLTQSGNLLVANTDGIQLNSNGPGIYFNELDQAPYRGDYGRWRIIADQNSLFFEDWERANSGEAPYAQQDEFLSFQRAPTGATSFPIGNHIIQWNYSFLGQGARDLSISANRPGLSSISGIAPRTLSLSALNNATDQLVPAVQIIPGGNSPIVSIPSGSLQLSGSSGGIHLFDRTTNAPSSWFYSPQIGVTSIYSDTSKKDVLQIRDTNSGTQLCLGNTCLTESQLQALLRTIGQ